MVGKWVPKADQHPPSSSPGVLGAERWPYHAALEIHAIGALLAYLLEIRQPLFGQHCALKRVCVN
jgi:hypothetical protein